MENDVLKNILDNYNTPLYVFDIRSLKKRIKFLREQLNKNIFLCYAIKANTFILKDIESDVERFEVCSPGEYKICKKLGINPEKLIISGVYKTPEAIKDMVAYDVIHFTVESIEQFKLLKGIKSIHKLKLMIRLTSGNQFGLDENEVEEIIKNRSQYENIEIVGIQYFSGTQKSSVKHISKEIQYIEEFIKRLYEHFGFETQELEFGPGFPVYYFKDKEFDEETYLREFSKSISEMNFRGKLILEVGRSLVAECGSYITKVVDKKINKNQRYAILDGGINHLVYYGQSMAMKIPKCEIYPKRDNQNMEKWNLCGALCTINDILVKQFLVSNLNIGDIFIFKNTGAYCMTEGIALFLSRELPMVVKIKEDGNLELIRKNIETYNLNM